MKKFLLLTGFILSFFSCSDDLQFNTPSFQGEKDNVFWRAQEFSAISNQDGSMRIVGKNRGESVILNITNTNPGTYTLGPGTANSAVFKTTDGINYLTNSRNAEGEIVIEAIDFEQQNFTGTFRFNAESSEADIINFNKGIFYKVPLVNEDINISVGTLRATVDGTEVEMEEVITVNADGQITIEAKNMDNSFIRLTLPESIEVGSYNLTEQSETDTFAHYGFTNGIVSNAQYGTLFVLEHDSDLNMISGTFTFNTEFPNNVAVENGVFEVYY